MFFLRCLRFPFHRDYYIRKLHFSPSTYAYSPPSLLGDVAIPSRVGGVPKGKTTDTPISWWRSWQRRRRWWRGRRIHLELRHFRPLTATLWQAAGEISPRCLGCLVIVDLVQLIPQCSVAASHPNVRWHQFGVRDYQRFFPLLWRCWPVDKFDRCYEGAMWSLR